ncbi:MAG: hypothetical protein U0736_26860 [Gemmataceae bacterium]
MTAQGRRPQRCLRLGCTLYFLLAARPPFAGETLTQVLLKHQMQLLPLAGLRPDVPGGSGGGGDADEAKRPRIASKRRPRWRRAGRRSRAWEAGAASVPLPPVGAAGRTRRATPGRHWTMPPARWWPGRRARRTHR